MKKKTIWITSAAVGAVLVLGGAGIAVAVTDPFDGDDQLTGTTLDRASEAALDAVGSGTVTDSETSDDAGHAYEVEVTLPNGEDTDVLLDDTFSVVRVDGGTAGATAPSGDATPGASTEPSSQPTDDALPALTEEDTAAASAAALAAVPAGTIGTVTEVERSDDFDHAYEVEITLENGEDIDVELDEAFAVLTVDGVPAA
ncbi:PepSY domain-containing protein [Cryobacterium sp. AP23]